MAYKMILNNSIVDADLSPCYARYNPKLKMFLECNAENAQFIASRNGDQWWHIAGTSASDLDDYETVDVVESDDDEVAALMAAFDAKREPIQIVPPVEEPVPEEAPSDDAIQIIREHTTSRIMSECEQAICDGFSVILSDGCEHHFTLTQADQLNLISLSNMKTTFADGVPYQANGEEMRLYPFDDFDVISQSASACRAKHYIYAKQLCAYANTLETIADLQGITYGMELPSVYSAVDGIGGVSV